MLQATPRQLPQQLELTAVPFHPQELYQCGPAALATVLNWSGEQVRPSALVDEVYLPGRQGSLQLEMLVRAYDPCISCSTHMVKIDFR